MINLLTERNIITTPVHGQKRWGWREKTDNGFNYSFKVNTINHLDIQIILFQNDQHCCKNPVKL